MWTIAYPKVKLEYLVSFPVTTPSQPRGYGSFRSLSVQLLCVSKESNYCMTVPPGNQPVFEIAPTGDKKPVFVSLVKRTVPPLELSGREKHSNIDNTFFECKKLLILSCSAAVFWKLRAVAKVTGKFNLQYKLRKEQDRTREREINKAHFEEPTLSCGTWQSRDQLNIVNQSVICEPLTSHSWNFQSPRFPNISVFSKIMVSI